MNLHLYNTEPVLAGRYVSAPVLCETGREISRSWPTANLLLLRPPRERCGARALHACMHVRTYVRPSSLLRTLCLRRRFGLSESQSVLRRSPTAGRPPAPISRRLRHTGSGTELKKVKRDVALRPAGPLRKLPARWALSSQHPARHRSRLRA